MSKRIRIYIAGAWADMARLRLMRKIVEELGFICTSRWMLQDRDYAAYPRGPGHEATTDISDVDRANFVVVDTFGVSRGGRDFECGYAYGIGKRIIRVGPVVNPFNALAKLAFKDWDGLLAHLAQAMEHADVRDN